MALFFSNSQSIKGNEFLSNLKTYLPLNDENEKAIKKVALLFFEKEDNERNVESLKAEVIKILSSNDSISNVPKKIERMFQIYFPPSDLKLYSENLENFINEIMTPFLNISTADTPVIPKEILLNIVDKFFDLKQIIINFNNLGKEPNSIYRNHYIALANFFEKAIDILGNGLRTSKKDWQNEINKMIKMIKESDSLETNLTDQIKDGLKQLTIASKIIEGKKKELFSQELTPEVILEKFILPITPKNFSPETLKWSKSYLSRIIPSHIDTLIPVISRWLVNSEGYENYLRFFTLIHDNFPELVSVIANKIKGDFSKGNMIDLRNFAIAWWDTNNISIEKNYSDIILLTSKDSLKAAALMRFQDRTDLPLKGGGNAFDTFTLECEALKGALKNEGISKDVQEIGDLLSKAFQEARIYSLILEGAFDFESQDKEITLAEEILKRIRQLITFPQDVLIVPIHSRKHITLATFLLLPGQKSPLALFTNTGEGLNWHLKNGTKFETTGCLGQVPESWLTEEGSKEAISNLSKVIYSCSYGDVNLIYESLNKALGNPKERKLTSLILNDSEIFHYPSKLAQHGGTCSEQAVVHLDKYLFSLILYERRKKEGSDSATAYRDAEMAINLTNEWIQDNVLHIKQTKIEKKSVKLLYDCSKDLSSFKKALEVLKMNLGDDYEMTLKEEHIGVKNIEEEPSPGRRYNILKVMSRALAAKWLREGKDIKDIPVAGILEAAVLRLNYSRKQFESARHLIQQMPIRKLKDEELQQLNSTLNKLSRSNAFSLISKILIEGEFLEKISFEDSNCKFFMEALFPNLDASSLEAVYRKLGPRLFLENSKELNESQFQFLFYIFLSSKEEIRKIILEPLKSIENKKEVSKLIEKLFDNLLCNARDSNNPSFFWKAIILILDEIPREMALDIIKKQTVISLETFPEEIIKKFPDLFKKP